MTDLSRLEQTYRRAHRAQFGKGRLAEIDAWKEAFDAAVALIPASASVEALLRRVEDEPERPDLDAMGEEERAAWERRVVEQS